MWRSVEHASLIEKALSGEGEPNLTFWWILCGNITYYKKAIANFAVVQRFLQHNCYTLEPRMKDIPPHH